MHAAHTVERYSICVFCAVEPFTSFFAQLHWIKFNQVKLQSSSIFLFFVLLNCTCKNWIKKNVMRNEQQFFFVSIFILERERGRQQQININGEMSRKKWSFWMKSLTNRSKFVCFTFEWNKKKRFIQHSKLLKKIVVSVHCHC